MADKVFLSNLEIDLTEKDNLASKYPEKVKELIGVYGEWQHFRAADFAELPEPWRP